MAMSRKHYRVTADMFKQLRLDLHTATTHVAKERAVTTAMETMGEMFVQDNPNFDANLFYIAATPDE